MLDFVKEVLGTDTYSEILDMDLPFMRSLVSSRLKTLEKKRKAQEKHEHELKEITQPMDT